MIDRQGAIAILQEQMCIRDRLCTSSFRERKSNPGKLTIDKLQILLELTKKEMKFSETA